VRRSPLCIRVLPHLIVLGKAGLLRRVPLALPDTSRGYSERIQQSPSRRIARQAGIRCTDACQRVKNALSRTITAYKPRKTKRMKQMEPPLLAELCVLARHLLYKCRTGAA